MERPATIEVLLEEVAPRVERALVASYGLQVGLDAAAAATAVGWEQAERLLEMSNPGGYLYTVGRNHVKRAYRPGPPPPDFPPVIQSCIPEVEPGLPIALSKLTEQQRRAVILIHCFGYSYRETAELLDVSLSSLRNHARRGIEKLRQELGVTNEPREFD
jgi:DNA-directed RNA polymerase specialized sigma24 family protein